MSILVTCPNGHQLKLKDHWAGKSGRCPQCRAKIQVPAVKHEVSDDDALAMLGEYSPPRPKRISKPKPAAKADKLTEDDDIVLTSYNTELEVATSGQSLLRSAVVHHKKTCNHCGKQVDQWFAKCNHCGNFFDHQG